VAQDYRPDSSTTKKARHVARFGAFRFGTARFGFVTDDVVGVNAEGFEPGRLKWLEADEAEPAGAWSDAGEF